MNESVLKLSGVSSDRLPFRIRPNDNNASTGTGAENVDKYGSASLLRIGNRLESCCQKESETKCAE